MAGDYPDVRTGTCHVNAMSMYVVTRPASFDVVVATSLMGDIIRDEASAVAGSIGLAASANLHPARTGPSMFEPIHAPRPTSPAEASPTRSRQSARANCTTRRGPGRPAISSRWYARIAEPRETPVCARAIGRARAPR